MLRPAEAETQGSESHRPYAQGIEEPAHSANRKAAKESIIRHPAVDVGKQPQRDEGRCGDQTYLRVCFFFDTISFVYFLLSLRVGLHFTFIVSNRMPFFM